TRMTNTEIAQTLEAYAALLDLAGAGHYTVRAYRRAAELVRETRAPVAELVATGRLAELEELEREVEPQLVALGRFVGLGPQRMVALGRSLGIRTADELRAAAAAGRLREVRGIGPVTERKILDALTRERPHRRRGLLLNRARALAHALADELGATVAGDVRRWRDVVYDLALVASSPEALERLERSP